MVSLLDCAYNPLRYLECKRRTNMHTLPDPDTRRECWVSFGIHLEPADDDLPNQPIYEPLASGQRRRYLVSAQVAADRISV